MRSDRLFTNANRLMVKKRYSDAINIYMNVKCNSPWLRRHVEFNVALCHQKIKQAIIVDKLYFSNIDYAEIKESKLFDEKYYAERNPDIATQEEGCIQHYCDIGWREGRDPSSKFSTSSYLTAYPDVRISGANPLLHYIRNGQLEGRPLPGNSPFSITDVDYALKLFAPSITDSENLFDTPIDIIIPVHNGYNYLDRLFESIINNTTIPYRLLVADDCSFDSRVWAYLCNISSTFRSGQYLLFRNETNQGFVKTVNRLVTLTRNHFVILNTDVEVPRGWLQRLMRPIFKRKNVASTTPFTNSGTICSFPEYIIDNDIYDNMSVDELDSYFMRINQDTSIEIPTGVGFCMGVNRQVVGKIGMFDEVFGRGYSEENDWCQRAKSAGFINLHVTNLFVYHKHGGSFCSIEKNKLQKENYEVLTKRHLSYESQIEEFVNKNELSFLRTTLINVMECAHFLRSGGPLRFNRKNRICYVGHMDSRSGVGQAARATISALKASKFVVDTYSLEGKNWIEKLCYDVIKNLPIGIILHLTAQELLQLAAHHSEKLRVLKSITHIIGVWAWESDQPAEEFAKCAEFVDEVWAISEYMRPAVEAVGLNVNVIPHALIESVETDEIIEKSILDIRLKYSFVVGYILDLRSYIFRKNPAGVIEAFRTAFPIDGDAALILKVSGVEAHEIEFLELTKIASRCGRVFIITESWRGEEVKYFYENIDVYLALFRAEGFGLTISEALASGVPVICPRYSGVLEFAREDEGVFFVKHSFTEIPENWGPYKKGWKWAEPSILDAARFLVDLSEDVIKRKVAGARGRRAVTSRLGVNRVGQLIMKCISAIEPKFP